MVVLVRGVVGIGSAVALLLFQTGYSVVLHDESRPTTTRRGMAFADSVFDGQAVLEQVRAVRADTLPQVTHILDRRDAIPVHVHPWEPLWTALRPRVLIDARMRKHAAPENQIGYADLTIGLGPGLIVWSPRRCRGRDEFGGAAR